MDGIFGTNLQQGASNDPACRQFHTLGIRYADAGPKTHKCDSTITKRENSLVAVSLLVDGRSTRKRAQILEIVEYGKGDYKTCSNFSLRST